MYDVFLGLTGAVAAAVTPGRDDADAWLWSF